MQVSVLFAASALLGQAPPATPSTQPTPPTPPPAALERYLEPPQPIRDAVLAPWERNVSLTNLSPDRKFALLLERPAMPALADFARPHRRLAGVEVDPAADRQRDLWITAAHGMRVRRVEDGREVPIALPKGARAASPRWSPAGDRIAFLLLEDRRNTVWVADTETGKARRVSDVPLLATSVTDVDWVADGTAIMAVALPENRPPAPQEPEVPATPQVRVTDGTTNAIRTFASLLETPTDGDLLEYHLRGRLVRIDVRSGRAQTIGEPAMFSSVSPSHDGAQIWVGFMQRPFSYLVPAGNFPTRSVIWDASGKELVEIAKQPLRVGAPGATGTPAAGPGRPANAAPAPGRRGVEWRPDGKGLSYLQLEEPPKDRAEDAPPFRPKDRVMQWLPPFRPEDAKVVYESTDPIQSVRYSEDGQTLFLSHTAAGRERLVVVRLKDPSKPVTLINRRTDDFFGDPGSLVSRAGRVAGSVVRMSADGGSAYLAGVRYSREPMKEAPRPFLDRVDLASGKTTRIFESKADLHESPQMMDDEGNRLMVVRQSRTQVPNTFLVDLAAKTDVALTQNRDWLPDVTQARRETMTVTRADGFRFQVTVTVPRTALPGAKLPALFWFYPDEVADQAEYDRSKRTFNRNQFLGVGRQSKAILLRAGYALVENDCPIVGPAATVNNGYVPQLRNNLSATIDALDASGWVDRRRLAIGGHSYGAFSTLNAMVHTPFFRAGIAGSGNYNRTLTPFGFQSEGRQLWDGREMYANLSPFLFLEQLNGAVLLTHGMEDQNIGTAPINSVRMFQALEALGKTAALAMYPYEDHGQSARETVLDMWARWIDWLDRHVKNAKP